MDTDAANKALDADAALQELGSDLVGQAYVTATVTVWDEDAAHRRREAAPGREDHPGPRLHLHARDASTRSRPGSAALPGHVYANVRQPPISTLNLAHMMPFSAVWAGPERDEHFEAPPLFFARTEGSTPFRFSLHVGDVGHTLIVGPTGAGKSVLLALMALQFRRYAGAQVFAFDFGGSIRAAALAMGGDWHDLGGALADDVAEPVALQPLARIDDAGERAWAAEWVAALLAREGRHRHPGTEGASLVGADLARLGAGRRAHAHRPFGSAAVERAEAGACSPIRVGGPWGRLLDAETERLGEAEVQAFETEGLIGAGAAPAVLSYLFHRIEDRLDGRPTLLIIDEGWLALDDHGFAGQLREWLKTLRKKNASVIFATQSLADIDGSAIAPAIIESCPTRLFLPNERALEPQIAADLSPLRPQRPADRDPEPRDAEARLLLPVAPRQPPVRARPVAKSRSPSPPPPPRPTRPPSPRSLAAHGRDELRRRLAAPQGPRLGGRHARQPQTRRSHHEHIVAFARRSPPASPLLAARDRERVRRTRNGSSSTRPTSRRTC